MATPFYIKLAGRLVYIEPLYDYIQEYCKDYVVEKKDVKPDIVVSVQAEDIVFEAEKSKAEDILEGREVRHFSKEYLETLAVYRKIANAMLEYQTILFHGSVIAVDGAAYIFTAKSGTGKSTHTRLWREYLKERAVMVNDDKPLLRISEEGVVAYGTPWDGKHRMSSNIAVPVRGICILKRQKENYIVPIGRSCAFPLLLQQTYRSKKAEEMAVTLGLLDKMMEKVSLYELGCNMDIEAAKVAYEGMCEGRFKG